VATPGEGAKIGNSESLKNEIEATAAGGDIKKA
jgi:hypothetical protein